MSGFKTGKVVGGANRQRPPPTPHTSRGIASGGTENMSETVLGVVLVFPTPKYRGHGRHRTQNKFGEPSPCGLESGHIAIGSWGQQQSRNEGTYDPQIYLRERTFTEQPSHPPHLCWGAKGLLKFRSVLEAGKGMG